MSPGALKTHVSRFAAPSVSHGDETFSSSREFFPHRTWKKKYYEILVHTADIVIVKYKKLN